ncbi:MAG: electron transport complex subunit RsxA [Lachnospiraceae bacterium]|nr:electron transport complex subunit RsxA [Lachnospiraceae bacterium]
MTKLIYVAIISAFVNNVVLSQGLGVDTVLEESKKMETSLRLSLGVLIITLVSSSITWPLGNYVFEKFGLSFLNSFCFLIIEAILVWLFIKLVKAISAKSFEKYKALYAAIAINSAVLGCIQNNVTVGYSFLRSTVNSFFGAIGFGIVVIILTGIRERIQYNDIPRPFEGVPILMVSAGLMAIAFYGFTGMI